MGKPNSFENVWKRGRKVGLGRNSYWFWRCTGCTQFVVSLTMPPHHDHPKKHAQGRVKVG